MKRVLILMVIGCSAVAAKAQNKSEMIVPDQIQDTLTVEAACGQCKLGLPGKGCGLAVRLNGNAYFVDGTDIDEHGDAHASDGFCNAVRKARVQGTVVKDRFKATYFKLLPEAPKKEKSR